MEHRLLGPGRLDTSALALGCMGMSQGYGPRDDTTSIATIHRAVEHGITMIDTATTYGLGHNEELVGRALRGRREQAVLATKFGIVRDGSGPARVDGSPDNARAVCEQSLKRLGVDRIDLYYLHRVDPHVAVEESIGAMAELVAEGMVGHLGISEATPQDIERAAKIHPITALQSEWSLWCRDIEAEILPTARRLGIGVVPYSPLGRGFLAGAATDAASFAPDDWRRNDERFSGSHLAKNEVARARLALIAADLQLTMAQLVLAWFLAQGDDVVPAVGMTSPDRVGENVASVTVAISPADIQRIESAVPPGAWSGQSSGFRRARPGPVESSTVQEHQPAPREVSDLGEVGGDIR